MYYFIGIKEPGMSALASVFYDLGYEVIGSDNKEILENEELLPLRGVGLSKALNADVKPGAHFYGLMEI